MNTQKDTLTQEQKADLRKKLMDWNTAKTCIRSYLTTPAKANRFFDRSYPCYKLYNTGLIVTFYLVLSENSDNIEILNIDDRLLHGWNVDIEALKQAAEIGDKARGYKVESLSDLIGEMGDKATQEAYSEVNFLNEYVVTTSPRHSVSYAAAGIVTQEVRQQLRELFPCGCYLFPASIHDIIILDKTEVNEDFAELIHDNITRTTYANDTSNYNPDSEFLSDIVLQYNPGTDTYTIAGSDL